MNYIIENNEMLAFDVHIDNLIQKTSTYYSPNYLLFEVKVKDIPLCVELTLFMCVSFSLLKWLDSMNYASLQLLWHFKTNFLETRRMHMLLLTAEPLLGSLLILYVFQAFIQTEQLLLKLFSKML